MNAGDLPFSQPTLALDLLALLLGLCIGSFLNVVALRSLSEESFLWPPSKCPNCNHKLSPLDNIPVVSWMVLGGKCRYCRKPISWQYPIVELFTGLTFVAVERLVLSFPHSPFNVPYWNGILISFMPVAQQQRFGNWNGVIQAAPPAMLDSQWWLIAGMLFFGCTLIAITVTDFREKLIPHEITYPSMIVGLIFSAVVRHDLIGAMVGIGASYILFDFIAFYGLKVYTLMHGGSGDEATGGRRLRRGLALRARGRIGSRLGWKRIARAVRDDPSMGPMEVMGGGDAVLSAVMSAYLGWQLLVVSLAIGFLAGTLMGMGLLVREMAKANLLHKCLQISGIAAVIGAAIFGGIGFLIDKNLAEYSTGIALPLAGFGAIGGALLGVVSVGTRVSKPYPFGPALALGGFIAMFLLPNWLSLH